MAGKRQEGRSRRGSKPFAISVLVETIELAVRLKFGPDAVASVISEIQAATLAQLEAAKAAIQTISFVNELHPLLSTLDVG